MDLNLRAVFVAAILLIIPSFAQQRPVQPGVPAGDLNQSNYTYLTGTQRLQWFAASTVGATSLLAAGPISAGWGTLFNSPKEYGPGWEGFGKRYGMRLTGVSTGNAIEATAGALLHEDPRYVRAAPGTPFGGRVKHVIVSTFLAHRPDGSTRFSYSRVAGNVGNNFLSNLWRADSEAAAGDAALRCIWGVTGRMSGQAFSEFWPDVLKLTRRK